MSKYLIFTDIAGRFLEFNKAIKDKPNHIIISNGDLNDRGLYTKELFDFFINNPQHIAILGNHEDMFKDFYEKTNRYDLGAWFYNGGINSILSFIENNKEKEYFNLHAHIFVDLINDYDKVILAYNNEESAHKDRPQLIKDKKDIIQKMDHLHEVAIKNIDIKYINFINNMPLYFECEDFFVCHAPLAESVSIELFKKEVLNGYEDFIWNRFVSFSPKKKLCIFGHNGLAELKEYKDNKGKIYAINLDSSNGNKLSAYDSETKSYIVINNH